jgi:dTDP-4-amino-4,6-dideoxygalactose transaminase
MELKALEVLRSGMIATGEYSERFSKAFATLIGQPHVVTTNDMSNAIQIALRLAGVREGDGVLTTAFSCLSTNAPIATAGASPVWVDVDPNTASVDLDSLNRVATKNCKALLLYHVGSYPGPVEEVKAFCEKRGIVMIEDCDNALLATVSGRQVGSWGKFSIYSFYPNRQINASEGGALACRDLNDSRRAIKLRRYGIDLLQFRTPDGEINPTCDVSEIGWAATLNNLCCSLALEQVSSVADRVSTARHNARTYDLALADVNGVSPIVPLSGAVPSYWTYLIRAKRRDELLHYLKTNHVGASRLHFLNTRYTGFRTSVPDLPGSSELMKAIIALPCGWWLTDDDVKYVSGLVRAFFQDQK